MAELSFSSMNREIKVTSYIRWQSGHTARYVIFFFLHCIIYFDEKRLFLECIGIPDHHWLKLDYSSLNPVHNAQFKTNYNSIQYNMTQRTVQLLAYVLKKILTSGTSVINIIRYIFKNKNCINYNLTLKNIKTKLTEHIVHVSKNLQVKHNSVHNI